MSETVDPKETGAGYYWHRYSIDNHHWSPVEVFQCERGHWWASPCRAWVDSWLAIENMGHFVGPIEKPPIEPVQNEPTQ